MTDFESAYLEELQGLLRGVLITVAEQLPALTVGLIDEMIDANECGVALEVLSEMLVESSSALDVNLVAEIDRLVTMMSMERVNVDRLWPLVERHPGAGV